MLCGIRLNAVRMWRHNSCRLRCFPLVPYILLRIRGMRLLRFPRLRMRELGTLLFNQYNEESKQLFPQQSENIRQLYAALQQDREELAYLKGKKICPNCGAELDGDVQRCTSCGMNVENVVRPSRIQAYCQSCGAQRVRLLFADIYF